MRQIAPSILSANYIKISEIIKILEKKGVDLIHVDAIDGVFAPNIGFSPKFVKEIASITDIPLDIHLMFCNPLKFVTLYIDAGARMISAHIESLDLASAEKFLEIVEERGILKGFAIKPSTEIPEWLNNLLEKVDYIVPMSVEPGFSGQKFIPQILSRIENFNILRKKRGYHYLIEADGGVNKENIKSLIEKGVDIFVIGAGIFGSNDIEESLEYFKKTVKEDGDKFG
ncbi:hypothetical protein B9P99_03520 [Candidatus Marsarchaeota G1 archaeon OSP_B]|jgi:Pentose-5-phosphate-3-epimerase|uniref:Ribulose-phosphate 3-epimerase n=3 Tax=Candidatus Marsarchaeota group 1 TaxID=2203770 RepID=A0A2R6ADI9_9ARCH|nr:MAG: hypothetical protein B9Q01_00910 [Candidatus Marsarchaeota G1 archaeon OSP_D]PSN89144.1 MAG: hypothetical protein B9Q00_02695 [Candidatus Marsarchaeota G1 archaeon OSP_C]PSN92351.1 MAG: hypothetical protein B9P99_03520 [Candidatus Marsarchaeota G1 archaeon OSP_B]